MAALFPLRGRVFVPLSLKPITASITIVLWKSGKAMKHHTVSTLFTGILTHGAMSHHVFLLRSPTPQAHHAGGATGKCSNWQSSKGQPSGPPHQSARYVRKAILYFRAAHYQLNTTSSPLLMLHRTEESSSWSLPEFLTYNLRNIIKWFFLNH